MTPEKDDPPLGVTKGDVVARTLGTLAGGIPGIGQMVQIAINETIPNVRLERIEAYLRHPSKRIDENEFKNALKTPEGLDLFEEGIWQAARALSEEQKQRIAKLVAKGLKPEVGNGQESRHFLRIHSQLDDLQILILMSHLEKYQTPGTEEIQEFWDKHRDILDPDITDDTKIDRVNLNYSMKTYLMAFGLLSRRELFDDMGQPPEKQVFNLTSLGSRFLSFIGVNDEDDE